MNPVPFLFCILAAFGCRDSESSSDPVLARVENAALKLSEANADGLWDGLSAEERTSRVEHWISQQSVYERALSEGVDKIPQVALLVEDAKKKIVLDAYFSAVADTIAVSEEETVSFYGEHPELFMRNADTYRLAVVTYANGKSAWQNYALVSRKKFSEAPAKNWMFREVEVIDSLSGRSPGCPVADLKTLEPGKLSPPKVCGKEVKSLVVLSKIDSGTVKPFEEVSDFAGTLALHAKRKRFLSSLKDEIKKAQAIFVYPEGISESAKR